MNNNVLIIFHRVDYDGLFSALIAKKFYQQNYYSVDLLGYTYGDALETDIQTLISRYSEICLVDISFNDETIMKALYKSGKAILIDHHETCLSLVDSLGCSDWPGLRRIGTGACELTWEYFFNGTPLPEIINRLSLYDVWNHVVMDWDTKILPIQYALRTSYGMSFELLWKDISYLFSPEALQDLEDDGCFVLKYLKKTWQGWAKNYSFEVTVAGRFRGICMLTPQFGSMPFEASEITKDYQVFVCANLKDGGNKYSLSLYSTPDKIGDFSLGAYVKSITQTGIGGGHACACGMELTKEQFIHLINKREI